MSTISQARAATVALNKLHAQIMSSVSPACVSAVYTQSLPEMTSTTIQDLHRCEQPAVETS